MVFNECKTRCLLADCCHDILVLVHREKHSRSTLLLIMVIIDQSISSYHIISLE